MAINFVHVDNIWGLIQGKQNLRIEHCSIEIENNVIIEAWSWDDNVAVGTSYKNDQSSGRYFGYNNNSMYLLLHYLLL